MLLCDTGMIEPKRATSSLLYIFVTLFISKAMQEVQFTATDKKWNHKLIFPLCGAHDFTHKRNRAI
jgi:hypothetical protein